jgi:hypothetical protein
VVTLNWQVSSGLSPQSVTLWFLANFQEALIFWFFCIKAKERMIDFRIQPVITPLCPISLGSGLPMTYSRWLLGALLTYLVSFALLCGLCVLKNDQLPPMTNNDHQI